MINRKMTSIMKKLAYFSAAILALIACNRQIETDNPQPEKQTLTFRAVLEQPDTKADLSDYSVVWQEGDQIAVFNGTTWVTSDELTAADIENEGRYADFQVTIDEGEVQLNWNSHKSRYFRPFLHATLGWIHRQGY